MPNEVKNLRVKHSNPKSVPTKGAIENTPATWKPREFFCKKIRKFLQEKKFCVLLQLESALQLVHDIPIYRDSAGLLGLYYLSAAQIPNNQRAPLFLYSHFNTFVTNGIC